MIGIIFLYNLLFHIFLKWSGGDILRDEEICGAECSSIPAEIEEELSRSGGVAGLIAKLPSETEIEAASKTYRALADPVRIKILYLLMLQPLCVCVIKIVMKMADSRLSYHLNILKKAGMIEGEQQGYYIIYNITPDARKLMEKENKRLLSK